MLSSQSSAKTGLAGGAIDGVSTIPITSCASRLKLWLTRNYSRDSGSRRRCGHAKGGDSARHAEALARRQKIEVSHDRFNSDVERLTNALAFVEKSVGNMARRTSPRKSRVETATRGIGRTRRSMPPTPQAQNAPLAFMSYVPEDSAAVKALSEKLEGRGVRIWRDTQHLHVGDLGTKCCFQSSKGWAT